MNRRVCFVASGGSKTGLGHVTRCRVLADKLSERGWSVDFAVQGDAADEAILKHTVGYPTTVQSELPASVGPADLVIVDTYVATAKDEQRFRQQADRVLCLEDRPTRSHSIDLLLDPTPGRCLSAYADLVDDGCGMLLGASYALLRSAFASHMASAGTATGGPRLFVSFGGADPPQATSFTLDALSDFDGRIDVAIGSLSPQRRNLEKILEARKDGSRLLVDADAETLAITMRQAELCVGAGGGMLLERCAAGAASVCLEIADNQRDLLAAAAAAGAIESIGTLEDVTASGLRNRIEALLDDCGRLQDMRQKANALCDGLGAERVTEILTGREKEGTNIRLRPVSARDCMTILEWQREPQARRYARNASVPTEEEHRNWFRNRMEMSSFPSFIIEANGEPAGFLRLDPPSPCYAASAEFEIAILVNAAYRGQGIALNGLQSVHSILGGNRAVAHVHQENRASVKAFRNAGFSEDDPYRRLVLGNGETSGSSTATDLERTESTS